MKKLCALMIAALAFPSWVAAQDEANSSDPRARGHLYIGWFGMELDEDRGVDSGDGVQVNLGWNFAKHWTLEGHFFNANLETGENQSTDFYHRGLGVDLQYAFGDRESVTPFILLGLGAVDNDVVPDSADETTLFLNAGLGAVGRIFDLSWLRWRLEARYFQDDYLDGLSDFRFGGGVEVAFARNRKTVVITETREVPVEVMVQPKDSDGDGVVDQYDRCPDTLPGSAVNGWGCVEEAQTVTLRNINFEFNSNKLRADSAEALDAAARFLQQQPNLRVTVAGHTDALGPDRYNMKLSQARSETVRQALQERGVAASRIEAVGYGESQLLDTSGTEAAHARNRRVEFRVALTSQ